MLARSTYVVLGSQGFAALYGSFVDISSPWIKRQEPRLSESARQLFSGLRFRVQGSGLGSVRLAAALSSSHAMAKP